MTRTASSIPPTAKNNLSIAGGHSNSCRTCGRELNRLGICPDYHNHARS